MALLGRNSLSIFEAVLLLRCNQLSSKLEISRIRRRLGRTPIRQADLHSRLFHSCTLRYPNLTEGLLSSRNQAVANTTREWRIYNCNRSPKSSDCGLPIRHKLIPHKFEFEA